MLSNWGVGEDSWNPLDSKETKPVNPKRNQPWIYIGRTDAEAEALTLWQPDVKSWLTGKDSSAGKDWGQEEKGVTEDEMVGWHRWLNGHEFEQALGDGEGQESWYDAVHGVAKSQTWLSHWITIKCTLEFIQPFLCSSTQKSCLLIYFLLVCTQGIVDTDLE